MIYKFHKLQRGKKCKQDCALWTQQAWEELFQGKMEPTGGEGKGKSCCHSAKDTGGCVLCSSCCTQGSQAESKINKAIKMTLNVLSVSSSLGKAGSSSPNPQTIYFYCKSEVSEQGRGWKLTSKYP